jgi:hypothetical protein
VPYSPWRSLAPKWWFPVIGTTTVNDATKTYVGVTTSGGDVLGRHTYLATVTNRSGGILYSYDRFYPTLSVAALRYDDDVVTFVSPSFRSRYTETTDRLLFQAVMPYRKVQWQAYGSVAAIRDHISGNLPNGVTSGDLARAGIFRGTLQGFRLGAVFNNAHEYLFSISRERGITASVDYENLNKSFGSDRSLQQIRGDIRGYLTIPWARAPLGRHVLAVRAAAARNSGDFVFQRELKVGGEGTDLLQTLDITDFPVRGFDSATLRAQSATIGSVEYRFPIYELDRGPTGWPIFFNRIHGDVFSDAGRAAGETISSAGAEVAADFILINALAVRYRVGIAVRITEPDKGKVQAFVGVGSSF